MKIDSLHISNFRGIRDVNLAGLGSMVIIAGQNGSGKSCIFDAIRLLKSVYGGYQQNEWQHWMGEFQITLSNKSENFSSMFNNAAKELRISADFKFSSDERAYLSANASDLLREYVWRLILPEAYEWGGYRMAAFAAQFRDREPEVQARVNQLMPVYLGQLAGDVVRGECFINPGDLPRITDSVVLPVVFSTFRPQHIGVIDYHGAQRHYGRENVQGINLSLDSNDQQKRHSALYNYANKYTNVKSEMASSYIREIVAEQAGLPKASQSTLTGTLKELFETFFPDKIFLGPTPNKSGTLSFPVQTASGSQHDLDELSSGEKEILYGYLRIRNSAPRDSIILLDEPELHLNPRLIRDLPQFYRKNLGEALNNQIWLVSHSDALLREVVGREAYNVYHMLPCGSIGPDEEQIRPLNVTADLDLAIVDLVGDIAAYRPGSKAVIFEGGGDSDFDRKLTSRLFPRLTEEANLISGSNKVRVKALHSVLRSAYDKGHIPVKFFAIVDKDTDADMPRDDRVDVFSWDVYHIENYLLEPSFISGVVESLGDSSISDEEVIDSLRSCASETLPKLIRNELGEFANSKLIPAIKTGIDPFAGDPAAAMHQAVQDSLSRISSISGQELTVAALEEKYRSIREKFESALADGSWTSVFPGREVLKKFNAKHTPKVGYEIFRNLIISRMADAGFQPEGMKKVIEAIVDA